MKKLWIKISNNGILNDTPVREKHRIRLINRLIFLCGISMFFISPVLLIQGVYSGVIANAIFLLISILSYYLVYKQHPTTAIGLGAIAFTLMMVQGAIESPDVGLEYFLLLAGLVSFILFKRSMQIWAFVFLVFSAFLLVQFLQLHIEPTHDLPNEAKMIQTIALACLIFGGLILHSYYAKKEQTKYEETILEQKNQIQIEKDRSDELLLNILPEETANELKQKGSADAKQFDMVTVLFTDFSGFTKMSADMSPEELVDELHHYFKQFDLIVDKYHIEKIKTIGDAYMCAGGLPTANKTNPWDVLNAAMEMQQFCEERKRQCLEEDRRYFEIRLGIHTGPVVAGIVGIRKFAYDIWGDTVNIASRMESHGEIGKINISESTYHLVKDRQEYQFTARGNLQVKGKGELPMYFVESSK